MSSELRRKEIIAYLSTALKPVSATELSNVFKVSRQVIVQDIALLRAFNHDILSTHRGYIYNFNLKKQRVFKIFHSDADTKEEMQTIVDCGGRIVEVFVNHKTYGIISAPLAISSRLDIDRLLEGIATGKSSLLKNTTGGYHFHTVEAPSEEILDLIEKKLREKDFLATVFEYETHLLEKKK